MDEQNDCPDVAVHRGLRTRPPNDTDSENSPRER